MCIALSLKSGYEDRVQIGQVKTQVKSLHAVIKKNIKDKGVGGEKEGDIGQEDLT